LRLTQVTLNFTMPETAGASAPATLTVAGASATTFTASASSGALDNQLFAPENPAPSQDPRANGWQAAPGGAALTFDPGYGVIYDQLGNAYIPTPADAELTLTAAGAAPATIPGIVNQAFVDANKSGLGDVVLTTVNGVNVPVRIVAVASSFPTVSGSGIVMDLPAIQAYLVGQGAAPLMISQWWLATDGAAVPPPLAASLPAGAAVTSRVALTTATRSDPLSAAPQQALLAMAVAAALLAITGFWVSIAADVRQRRAENALLAALGVAQRAAAARLFLEKLLLSLPSAVLGLVLGTVVARLLVPAVTLTATAQAPVPPPDTLLDLPQTLPLAALVAIVPALAAALVVFRRPDPAAELRAAEAA
jgi:hypothetical protein